MSCLLLRLSHGREGDLRLTVEEEDFPAPRRRSFHIDEESYAALGSPSAGDVLDDATLAALAEAEGRCEAVARAVRVLSYGACSANALCLKLRAKGYDRETAEAAVARMIARGYLNEPEQAKRLAVLAVRSKCWGSRRVYAYLMHKGYPAATARAAIAEAEAEGELDFSEARARLLAKLPPDAAPEQRRALLYKYGH